MKRNVGWASLSNEEYYKVASDQPRLNSSSAINEWELTLEA